MLPEPPGTAQLRCGQDEALLPHSRVFAPVLESLGFRAYRIQGLGFRGLGFRVYRA